MHPIFLPHISSHELAPQVTGVATKVTYPVVVLYLGHVVALRLGSRQKMYPKVPCCAIFIVMPNLYCSDLLVMKIRQKKRTFTNADVAFLRLLLFG